jgi:hypothetical protein
MHLRDFNEEFEGSRPGLQTLGAKDGLLHPTSELMVYPADNLDLILNFEIAEVNDIVGGAQTVVFPPDYDRQGDSEVLGSNGCNIARFRDTWYSGGRRMYVWLHVNQ